MTPDSPYEKVSTEEVAAEVKEMTLEEKVHYLEGALENAFNVIKREIQFRDQRYLQDKQQQDQQLSQAISMINLTLIQCVVTGTKLLETLEAKGVIVGEEVREAIKTEVEATVNKQQELINEYLEQLKNGQEVAAAN